MIEDGVVISRDNGRVMVKMIQKDSCKDCKICESLGGGYRSIEALDTFDVKVGDHVRVEVNPKLFMAASMLVFIVPLLFLILGYYIGIQMFGPQNEGAGIVCAILGMVISFFLVRAVDKARSKDHETFARVTSLLNN